MSSPETRAEWSNVEAMLDGILARRYYTNHGPLAVQLEAKLSERHHVEHAVVVTNETIGLLMMLEASQSRSSVMLSALTSKRVATALDWVGLTPIFCDVGRETLSPRPCLIDWCGDTLLIDPAMDDPERLLVNEAARRGKGVVFTAPPRGTTTCPVLLTLPVHGQAAAAACILTNDDEYAARLRNIRSSYGSGPSVPVRRTANGRVSEAQAGLVLIALCSEGLSEKQYPGHPGRLARRTATGCLRPFGSLAALTLPDKPQREAALQRLTQAGLKAGTPPPLDRRAGSCTNASHFVDCTLLLPFSVLQRPHELPDVLDLFPESDAT